MAVAASAVFTGGGSLAVLREPRLRSLQGSPHPRRRIATPAFCAGRAPRRACERRARAASWQVAMAAAELAGLWILDSTLCGGLGSRPLACAPKADRHESAPVLRLARALSRALPAPACHSPRLERGVAAASGARLRRQLQPTRWVIQNARPEPASSLPPAVAEPHGPSAHAARARRSPHGVGSAGVSDK